MERLFDYSGNEGQANELIDIYDQIAEEFGLR